jgi:hypothetical protein
MERMERMERMESKRVASFLVTFIPLTTHQLNTSSLRQTRERARAREMGSGEVGGLGGRTRQWQ